ncbi:ataxin-3 isoform X2 [Procambarus clarkii]|uniref:ataxin-3 isoform X2 n=2 Tax=Procambarus clarkii TaxID=6728 RepID=UPI00374263CD
MGARASAGKTLLASTLSWSTSTTKSKMGYCVGNTALTVYSKVSTSLLWTWQILLNRWTKLNSVTWQNWEYILMNSEGLWREQQAYICNFKEHWLTVRKLGHQWFNLNSLLSYPELISNTYLALFLKQLQHEGYSIFVVDGNLPPSEADETLRLHPAVQTTKPKLLSEISEERRHSKEDGDLKAALAASLASVGSSHEKHDGPPHSGEYYELLAAMQLSLENASPSKSQSSAKRDLQPNVSRYSDRASPQSQVNAEHSSEDENLQAAIRLSLGQHSPEIVDDDLERALQLSMSVEAEQGSPVGPSPGEPSSSDHRACVNLADRIPEATATHTAEEPDLEEIRQRRLAFLSKQTP